MRLYYKIFKPYFFVFFILMGLYACGGGGDNGSSRAVTISWTPNGERAVNTDGGGYTVYYSPTQGFDVASATETVTLSYDSSLGYTPYSFDRTLAPGVWYVRVKAYGKPLGGALVESPLSAEYIFVVE